MTDEEFMDKVIDLVGIGLTNGLSPIDIAKAFEDAAQVIRSETEDQRKNHGT